MNKINPTKLKTLVGFNSETMYKKTLFLGLLIGNLAFTQEHGISLHYRFGTSINNFKPVDLQSDPYAVENSKKLTNANDLGIVARYSFLISAKHKLYITSGAEFARSRHYQNIAIEDFDDIYETLVINKNRLIVQLFGLEKELCIIDERLKLILGWGLINRQYFERKHSYNKFVSQVISGYAVDYKYDLTSYYQGDYENNLHKTYRFINSEYLVGLRAKIFDNIAFNLGFTFSPNNLFFNDYSLVVTELPNTDFTRTYTYNSLLSQQGRRMAVNDHFLSGTIGISYRFGYSLTKTLP